MITKLSLVSLFILLPCTFFYSQTTVFAYVKDQEGKPIEKAQVDLNSLDNDVSVDKIGYFQYVDLKPGHYTITVTRTSYESKTIEFDISPKEKRKDLGTINLTFAPTNSDAGVIVLDDSGNDSGESNGSSLQPTVGLLSSGRDAFDNVSAFELGAYWFRPRGTDNRYEDVLFNGVPMSKNDDGKIDFSNWGGLNDVTRYPQENANNITPSEYTFGNLGGVVYYNTKASTYRKGISLAYSYTNRSYFNRAMATYSTGMTKSGWAVTVSGSRRWADRGVIDGTYQDSYAYFGSVEKKFSNRFSINLTAFGSPTYRASNSPNTQEVYDLMGKNYNAYWGYQDGEKRNSRIRKVFEPIFQLAFYNKIGKASNWNNTFSYQFGSDSRSRLDWFHASDPNPTYYRNLPSFSQYIATYLDSDGGNTVTAAEQSNIDALANSWKTKQNLSQISWNNLYAANIINRKFNDGSDHGAIYTVVDDVNKDKTLNYASHFDTRLSDYWKLDINLNYQNLKSDNFRRIDDLLGANFAYNLDAFGNDLPYNLKDSDVKVYKGDRTQYSYLLNRNQYSLNASTEADLGRWNIVASIFGSQSDSQREGLFKNHFYENNSYGKSAIYNSFDGGIKGKLTYKLDGKNFLVYDGAFFSLAPTLNEIFLNPRINDIQTPGVQSQIINSNDISYIKRGQILKVRLSAYYTSINNATEVSRYYAEGLQIGNSSVSNDAFVAEILSGINKVYKGLELGLDVKVTPTVNVTGVASVGDYKITNNPTTYFNIDSDYFPAGAQNLGKANLEGYKIAGTPQKAFSLGIRYNSPKYWWIGATGNYLMDNYLDFSALPRTTNFYTNPNTGDNYTAAADENTGYAIPAATAENVAQLLQQKKFDNEFMLNANAGKSFLIGKYRMGLSVSVNNVLNNRKYVTGGFEQGRASNFRDAYKENIEKSTPYFGPKLWYDRGINFFANVYLRF